MHVFSRSLSPLTAAILLALSVGAVADDDAEEYEFNPYFMSPGSQQRIDLNRYNQDLTPVGSYQAELIVNGKRVGRAEVIVKDRIVEPQTQSEGQVPPENNQLPEEKTVSGVDICINPSALAALDVNVDKLDNDAQRRIKEAKEGGCLALNQVLPENSVTFDSNSQALNLALPGVYLINRPRGYVNPELWDRGITAATLGYNLNASRTHHGKQDYDNLYGNINGGINLSGWYIRHNGIYTKPNDSSGKYRSLNTYVQRDIVPIKGRLIIGDANTKGELFDTLAFRGVQLVNEEQMLPNTLRGYAPVVRGTARTTAKVVIRQSGNVIYEKNVVPGPFEVTDLYPTGYGGNLDVTIEEADGSLQNFQVPYASTSNLLRPGTHHYSLTYGKLRSSTLASEPVLIEGTYRRGISNGLTLYSGIQGNKNYQAIQGGTSIGTPIGAFSFDITHAKTKLGGIGDSDQGSMSGQSYQLKYSQNIESTGSNLSLAAYRFSTDGYMDFMTGMSTREIIKEGQNKSAIRRPKNRLSISAAQTLPENYGQFYISAWQQAYWNSDETDRQYQLGYNNRYKTLTYGLSMTRSQDGTGKFQNTYMLNMMVPLDNLFGFNQMGLTVNRGPGNSLNEQFFASGSTGEDHQYSYSVTAGNTRQDRQNSSNLALNGSVRSPYTTMTGLVGTGKDYTTYSAGLSGAMVAHSGGLTFTPYNGDTYALVEAKGAKGAKVVSASGLRIDRFGYAVVPYLNAYQMNDIEISPKGLSNNVELNLTSQKVAPYSGAVVKVKYDTTIGYPVLISAPQANGQPLPFGAEVFDKDDRYVGAVGQGGRLFARVPSLEGILKVIWGEAVDQKCIVSYLLPKDADVERDNITKFSSVCQ